MAFDLLVIGGGPAGYTAAIRGAQCGLETLLVEDGNIGGTCLNTGCIPSKALLSATCVVAEAEASEPMGVYIEPYVDFTEMSEWKDGVVDQLTGGVEQLCRSNGVTIEDGRARFTGPHTVEVGGDEVEFEKAIIATGSRPFELPGFSFNDGPILDAAQALDLDVVPSRLLVIGAGYIGMELSTVFARLGSKVTVVEQFDSVLPQYENGLTEPVEEHANQMCIDFRLGVGASEWRQTGGDVVVSTDDDNKYHADKVLVAVGRTPVTDGLGLEAVDIETTKKGFIETDRRGRTNREHVFAVGDVAGDPMLAHAGVNEGITAAETITGEDPTPHTVVPEVVFTDPEIASVGKTPDEVREAGGTPAVGMFPFTASGRAMTVERTEGFVRLVGDEDGVVVGGQIVGPEASELVGEITVAIESETRLSSLESIIHPHPTFSEAIMEAAGNALGKAIHTRN